MRAAVLLLLFTTVAFPVGAQTASPDVTIPPPPPAGVALTLAAGVTFRSGALNVPMTFAVVPSKAGTRIRMLTGFNLRGRR